MNGPVMFYMNTTHQYSFGATDNKYVTHFNKPHTVNEIYSNIPLEDTVQKVSKEMYQIYAIHFSFTTHTEVQNKTMTKVGCVKQYQPEGNYPSVREL
jgi:hypothetical protein